MDYKTADLCDQYSDTLSIATPGQMKNYGGKSTFRGIIETVECFEDNSFVRKILETNGDGKVLVVDGGGSMQCALLGDILAALAIENNWCGVVVNGCIRDSEVIGGLPIGVKALATNPLKSVKNDVGKHNVVVEFCNVRFTPGHWLFADTDGIVISPTELGVNPT